VVADLVISKGADSASYHLKRLEMDSMQRWLILRQERLQDLQPPSQVESLSTLSSQWHNRQALDG
jgi:hypothetical protein